MGIKSILNAVAIIFIGVSAMAQKKELKAGETLGPGTAVFSQNGKFVLIMENSVPSGRYGQFATFATDNFSLARDKGIMSSQPKVTLGKATTKAQKLTMQTDGNLVAYDQKNGTHIWDAQTSVKTADPKTKAVKMIVENDGTISVYNAANQKLWNNKTGKAPLSPAVAATATKPAPAAPAANNTESSVYNKIIALKPKYPHGMKWTNDNIVNGNGGCYAFSMICMDAAFGTKREEKRYTNFNNIRIGDMIRINKDTHSMIVIAKDNKQFTFAEGNYGSKIYWGRTMTIAELKSVFNYGLTSYP